MSAITDDVLITPEAYVSLYAKTPFYGGPEEGGWWGHDVVLVSHQSVSSAEEAEAVKARLKYIARHPIYKVATLCHGSIKWHV